jgi:hypothetical protein
MIFRAAKVRKNLETGEMKSETGNRRLETGERKN